MRTFKLALLILPLVALGCRTNPNEMLLERESRMLEDKIYHLESLLDDCHSAREATIRENEALKKEVASGDRGAGPSYAPPSVELPSQESAPARRSRRKEPEVPLEAPTIELPEPSDTPPMGSGSGNAPAAAIEGTPTTLVINKRLTGGMDRDGQNGDEGILVVFEPRDASGQLVKTAGTVSVVLLDPAEQGPAARVARWDFAADEVTSHFQNTVFGRGLQFELPWPGNPPKNRDLQLFVRFTTAAGEKLTTDMKIQIRTPGDPPRVDRQTKSWSATQNASRPSPRRSTPSSRLKSSPRSTTQRERSRANDDDTSDTRADSRGAPSESLREASRSGRPVWKPYR
ncbi:MAG: hypothetical protein HY288_12520 [Planctomycetia bacterium]|nr:hypothetical protein [Planctomycetia bacterium]